MAKMKLIILPLILTLTFISCSDSTSPIASRDFNLKFSYGVGARNILNTFQNTYTKDLILDGTVTVPFALSDSELNRISAKMTEIGFFAYPDTFIVKTGDTVGIITPSNTYIYDVSLKSANKKLYWNDEIINPDTQAVKLRELNTTIRTIIQSKPEYAKLPPARGGYL